MATDTFGRDTVYLRCMCENPPCMVALHYNSAWDEVSIYSQLDHYLPWYKRAYYGVKYILGVRVGRFHFSETLVRRDVLEDALDDFRQLFSEHRAERILSKERMRKDV